MNPQHKRWVRVVLSIFVLCNELKGFTTDKQTSKTRRTRTTTSITQYNTPQSCQLQKSYDAPTRWRRCSNLLYQFQIFKVYFFIIHIHSHSCFCMLREYNSKFSSHLTVVNHNQIKKFSKFHYQTFQIPLPSFWADQVTEGPYLTFTLPPLDGHGELFLESSWIMKPGTNITFEVTKNDHSTLQSWRKQLNFQCKPLEWQTSSSYVCSP